MPRSLETIRAEIDALDRALLRSLIERVLLVREAAALKVARDGVLSFDPTREAAVVRRLLDACDGELGEDEVRCVWEAIFEVSRSAQRRVVEGEESP